MKMSFKSKFFYAGGDFGINIMWQLTVFYLLFFYTDVFGLSPAKAGLVFFIAKIWDGFTDPLMGILQIKQERDGENLGPTYFLHQFQH